MDIKTWMCAAAAAALLTACETNGPYGAQPSAAWTAVDVDPDDFAEDLAALRTDAFRYPGETAADLDAVIAAAPSELSISYDELALDVADGATVLRGVRVTAADTPDIGIAIEELRFWGLDAEFAAARLNGERLQETAPLARRIYASDMSLFGLETLMNPVFEGYTQTLEDALESAIEDEATPDDVPDDIPDLDLAVELQTYEASIDQLVLDDVVLRPWSLVPISLSDDPVDEADEAESALAAMLPWAQGYAAFAGAVAMDTLAAYGMTAEVDYSDATGDGAFALSLDSIGYKGLRGGDLDYGVGSGFAYTFDLTPPEELEGDAIGFEMAGSLETYAFEGLRGDTLLGYLARGEAPGRNVTDLMSLGVWTYENEQAAINGRPFYSVEAAKADLRGFHWAIPTDISFEAENIVYNIAALAELVVDVETQIGSEDAEFQQNVDAFMSVLRDNDLDILSMDVASLWNWDADTGETALDVAYGIDDFLRFDMAFDGALPTFDGVAALAPEGALEDTDFGAIGDMFMGEMALAEAELNIVDEGGLEKGFALAIAIAQLDPEGDNFLANATPESLRQMASSMMYFSAAAMTQEFPPAQDFIAAAAGFVAEGGALRLALAPEAPVGSADIEALIDEYGVAPAAGEALVDLLGLSLVHEGPEDEGEED